MSGTVGKSPPDTPSFEDKLVFDMIDETTLPSELIRPMLIHNQTIASISNFHRLYVESQRTRAEATHEEQDLLRAMLLFACSGLDAVVKQLIQDALATVLDHDEGAQREFKKFVERRLKRASGLDERDRVVAPIQNFMDAGFLAELLVSFQPRAQLISALTNSLVSDSLQSRDQLLKVAAHFALTKEEVMEDDKVTRAAFDARNQIAHEMDVDLESGKGRRDRNYATMVAWSENIARVSRNFIEATEAKIAGATVTLASGP
jgi:hypothetical protein